MFDIYLKLGFGHILDIHAYDHILFVMALCAVYPLKDWKKILVLITAFTVGHSLTLALSALKLVHVQPDLVETLIPITIIITAAINLLREATHRETTSATYLLTLFFGLIHGLGFSNYLNMLLGNEENIYLPLFAFNLGVEGGQIIIVLSTLALSYLLVQKLGLKQKHWTIGISFLAILVAIKLLLS